MASKPDAKKQEAPLTQPGGETALGPSTVATRPASTVAKPGRASGPQSDPYAEEGAGAGLTLPRIVLLQGLSQEVTRDEDPLPIGVFYDRLSKDNLGKSIPFIPFKHQMSRIRMEPGQGMLCRSTDMLSAQMSGGKDRAGKPTMDCGACVYRMWPEKRPDYASLTDKQKTSGPECSTVDNFLALRVAGEDKYPFAVFQFMRTSRKAAADLKSLWVQSERDLQDFVYVNKSVGVKGNTGAYFKQEISRLRETTESEHTRVKRVENMVLGEDIIGTVSAEEATEGTGSRVTPEAAAEHAAKAGF